MLVAVFLTSVFNSKVTEVKNKMKYLASKTELTAVENKKPNVSFLVTKQNMLQKLAKSKMTMLLLQH